MPITSATTLTIDSGANVRICSPASPERNPLARTSLMTEPTPIATPAPIALPRNPMNTASVLKRAKMRGPLMPIAFISPISRVLSCTLMRRVLMMPKPAAMSAITAKALRTRMMPSTTVWNVPIWSATVDPVKPAVARSSLMAWISESVASASNLAVALAYSAVAAAGIPVRWASKSAVVSAAFVLAPDPTRVGFWIPTTVAEMMWGAPVASVMPMPTLSPIAAESSGKPSGST